MWYNGGVYSAVPLLTTQTLTASGSATRDIAVNDDGDIFYKANDNLIHKMYYLGGWYEGALNPNAIPNVAGYLATFPSPNNGVVYKGTDNRIWGMWYNNGVYSEVILDPSAPSNVFGYITINKSNQLFYQTITGTDYKVHTMYYNTGCNCWLDTPLDILGGTTISGAIASSTGSFIVVDKEADKIFYKGNDNRIYGYYWNCKTESFRISNNFDNNTEEYHSNNFINIFPNPTSSLFFIKSTSERINSIIITDIRGQLVFKNSYGLENDIQINLSDKPNGIYFVKIHTAEKIFYQKIIKQ